MIKIVYGLSIPFDIFINFTEKEKDSLKSHDCDFSDKVINDDLKGIIYGKTYYQSNDNHVILDDIIVKGMNENDKKMAEDSEFQGNLQILLKAWLHSFKEWVSLDEAWESFTAEEKENRLKLLSLPDSIELSWYIVKDE